MDVAVKMQDIVKKFGDFVANDGINLTVKKGEVHAILGENGAGKSTLMNILYGLYHPTSGKIFIDGKETAIGTPQRAIDLGIGMVHQHFMLIPPFTVTENIALGMEDTKGVVLDLKKSREKIVELSKKYGLSVDPDAKIEDISVGMQQRVEIIKVLDIIKSLTKDGKSVILITHKLKEIKACADSCTIIRHGKYIDTVDVKVTSESELAAMMVGRDVSFTVEKEKREPGEVVLEVKDLCAKDYRKVDILKSLSLNVRRGEIVGIAGVDGNGQSELVEILTGLKKAESGSVTILGKNAFNVTPRQSFDMGITSIPEDRQKHGLVLDFTVAENLILQNFEKEPFSKSGILNDKNIEAHAKKLIEKFDIRPNDSAKKAAKTLSGGNQQKVIIAREVTNDSDLLIAVNPTRGLDVGAIEFVHRYLVEQRNKDKAVLLVSFELDEIMNLSDRIEVIFDGQITGEVLGEDADEKELGLLMAGGKKDE